MIEIWRAVFDERYTIEQKFKSAAAFLVILILFPYIVSVFVNGVDPEETTNENFYIRVKASEEEEADGIAEVEWNEYLTGVLAKDVPADTETEALKAQAVLVRTQISRALQRSTQAEETENQKSDRTGNVSDVILEIDYLSQKEMQDQWPADEYKKRYEKYRNAIESTENEVLFIMIHMHGHRSISQIRECRAVRKKCSEVRSFRILK